MYTKYVWLTVVYMYMYGPRPVSYVCSVLLLLQEVIMYIVNQKWLCDIFLSVGRLLQNTVGRIQEICLLNFGQMLLPTESLERSRG